MSGLSIAVQVADLAKGSQDAILPIQFASILPTGSINWPWLRELASIRLVHLRLGDQNWEKLRTALEQSRLLVTGNPRELTLLADGVTEYVLGTINAIERTLLKTEIHVVAARRLKQSEEMKKELIDSAMRAGNGGAAVTAWTVPTAAQVAAANADNPRVSVAENYDGSYSVVPNLPPGALWEEACINRFCTAMLNSDSLDDIEFLLRTPIARKFALREARPRIEQLCQSSPSLQSDIIRGLLSLNIAHWLASLGSWNSANGHAEEAYQCFKKLRQEHPRSADLTSLFEESLSLRVFLQGLKQSRHREASFVADTFSSPYPKLPVIHGVRPRVEMTQVS